MAETQTEIEVDELFAELYRSQIDNCAYENWYELFKDVKKNGKGCTIASRVVELSDAFLDYLQQDGVILPNAPENVQLRKFDPRNAGAVSEDAYDDFGDVDWENESSEDDESANEQKIPTFPDLEASIDQALNDLKNQVFVKLSWTSPQDARWVSGTLKCCSPGDIYLLLKSSDFVHHDISHIYENCIDYSPSCGCRKPKLILQRWSNLNQDMEFRCFVYDKQLVAIAQRYPQTFHPHLGQDHDVGSKLKDLIETFFYKYEVAETFPDTRFTFDVYIDKQDRVWLLDFGPLAAITKTKSKFTENTQKTDDATQKSNQILAVPPHELLPWSDLLSFTSGSQEAPPRWCVITSSTQASSFGDVKRSHRVPIELVTGELTQEVVDQAKAHLEAMNLTSDPTNIAEVK